MTLRNLNKFIDSLGINNKESALIRDEGMWEYFYENSKHTIRKMKRKYKSLRRKLKGRR